MHLIRGLEGGIKKPFCNVAKFLENPLRRLSAARCMGSVFDAADEADSQQEIAYSLMSGT